MPARSAFWQKQATTSTDGIYTDHTASVNVKSSVLVNSVKSFISFVLYTNVKHPECTCVIPIGRMIRYFNQSVSLLQATGGHTYNSIAGSHGMHFCIGEIPYET